MSAPVLLASDASYSFSLIFALAVLLGLLLKFWLASRQIRHIAQHRAAVPGDFASRISLEAHQKAADYTIVKARLGLIDLSLGAAVLIGWTLLGGLNALNIAVLQWLPTGLWQQMVLVLIFVLIGSGIDLPLSLYQTFVVEQRFGFNKMTWQLWLADAAKGLLLGAALGLPLLALLLWLMAVAGPLWWLYAWVALVLFNLFVMWLAPSVIMPLFNKFTPLQDEALEAKVKALMQRSGFSAKGFFVMDGSKRSAHSNAFFTGFGSSKRVVFFDTLLQQLSHDEMQAVLAHELGHFKHKHIVKRMFTGFGMTLLGLALLGWVSTQTWFYTGLGVMPSLGGGNEALAMLLFMLATPVFGFFISPLSAYFSRRDEFQADAYAVANAAASDLKSALLKLYEDNASTLTPDPWYVRFYYSHPPALQRLARFEAVATQLKLQQG
jgi:STE24 endopeptidase